MKWLFAWRLRFSLGKCSRDANLCRVATMSARMQSRLSGSNGLILTQQMPPVPESVIPPRIVGKLVQAWGRLGPVKRGRFVASKGHPFWCQIGDLHLPANPLFGCLFGANLVPKNRVFEGFSVRPGASEKPTTKTTQSLYSWAFTGFFSVFAGVVKWQTQRT